MSAADKPKTASEVVDEVARTLDPSVMPAAASAGDGQDGKPAPKKRLRQRAGLRAMSFFLMDMRLKLRFSTDPSAKIDADRALITITPEDAEMLEDIADTLDFFFAERQKARQRGSNR